MKIKALNRVYALKNKFYVYEIDPKIRLEIFGLKMTYVLERSFLHGQKAAYMHAQLSREMRVGVYPICTECR
jgi:hypothetical protein